jgi:hypothetical protein
LQVVAEAELADMPLVEEVQVVIEIASTLKHLVVELHPNQPLQ